MLALKIDPLYMKMKSSDMPYLLVYEGITAVSSHILLTAKVDQFWMLIDRPGHKVSKIINEDCF